MRCEAPRGVCGGGDGWVCGVCVGGGGCGRGIPLPTHLTFLDKTLEKV